MKKLIAVSLLALPMLANATGSGSGGPGGNNISNDAEEFTCHSTSKTFESNQWYMMALPCFSKNGAPEGQRDQYPSEVFANILPELGEYGTNWVIYTYTKDNGYLKIEFDEPITPHTGSASDYTTSAFWFVQNSGNPVTLELNDAESRRGMYYDSPQGALCNSRNGSVSHNGTIGCHRVALHSDASSNKWRMQGTPYSNAYSWHNARIVVSEVTGEDPYSGYPIVSSERMHWDEAKDKGYVHDHAWTYNGTSYVDHDMTPNGRPSIDPWDAMWIATLPSAPYMVMVEWQKKAQTFDD